MKKKIKYLNRIHKYENGLWCMYINHKGIEESFFIDEFEIIRKCRNGMKLSFNHKISDKTMKVYYSHYK